MAKRAVAYAVEIIAVMLICSGLTVITCGEWLERLSQRIHDGK